MAPDLIGVSCRLVSWRKLANQEFRCETDQRIDESEAVSLDSPTSDAHASFLSVPLLLCAGPSSRYGHTCKSTSGKRVWIAMIEPSLANLAIVHSETIESPQYRPMDNGLLH